MPWPCTKYPVRPTAHLMAKKHRIRKSPSGAQEHRESSSSHNTRSQDRSLPVPCIELVRGSRFLPNSMPLCHFEGDWPHGGATRPDSRCKKTSAGREPRTTLRRASRPMLSQWQIRTNVSRETLGRTKKRRITMDAAVRFAGSRFMRLREIGPIRKGYSSSSTAGATTSGMDAVGSKRRTTLPSRSTRNFVKFHLMSGLPA